MADDKILKGVVKGLGQLGVETLENASKEGQNILESVITGKELLGLERTMTDAQLEQKRQQEKIKSQQEINELRGEVSGKKDGNSNQQKTKERPRNLEDEITQLRRQLEKQAEEKEKYYEQQREKQRQEKEKEQAEYIDLTVESTNPSKQKKSRGSAFVNKKKHKPDMTQTSATQEFKGGKID
jgi:hypothetical protein